jgi:hypothetical protein
VCVCEREREREREMWKVGQGDFAIPKHSEIIQFT